MDLKSLDKKVLNELAMMPSKYKNLFEEHVLKFVEECKQKDKDIALIVNKMSKFFNKQEREQSAQHAFVYRHWNDWNFPYCNTDEEETDSIASWCSSDDYTTKHLTVMEVAAETLYSFFDDNVEAILKTITKSKFNNIGNLFSIFKLRTFSIDSE